MATVTAVDISQQVDVHPSSPSTAGLSSSSTQQQQQQSPPRRGILSSILCTETDSDIQEHGDSLNRLLDLVYTASTDHLKQVKTRLIEEKEIAVMDAERIASIQYEKYRNEIDRLQKELSSLEAKQNRSEDLRLMLRNKISYHLSATHRKHRSEYSLSKIFRAWYGEVQLSKQCSKMDNVAKALARRSLLNRTFLSMSSSLYRRKALKEHSEAKFKFDSLTNEVQHNHTSIYTIIHTYIHITINTYVHAYTYIHTYIHTYNHKYIRTYIYIHTYIQKYIHTYIHTLYTHKYIRTYIYIYTYIHTYNIHTYMHLYIHTCIYIYIHTCIP